jgi:hypothetical protein
VPGLVEYVINLGYMGQVFEETWRHEILEDREPLIILLMLGEGYKSLKTYAG